MTTDNTPLPLKGEPTVVGSPLGELPSDLHTGLAHFTMTQAGLAKMKDGR